VDERKPVWRTSSFLLYAGGLTVLLSALGALAYLAGRYGDAAYAGWAALVVVVLHAIARGFDRRGRWIAAGVFAFASVVAWAVFLGALWTWFGWLGGSPTPARVAASTSGSPFAGFSVARLSLELLVLIAARATRSRFHFPLLAAISAVVGWLFVTDLVSGGGDWSAVVTLLVGVAFFAAGAASDEPGAFWRQLVAGALIGGSALYWWHSTDWQWALIAVLALVYVELARRTRRSSWAVLAALGLLLAAGHFAVEWTRVGLPLVGSSAASAPPRLWVPPLVFAFAGFLLVALGLRSGRRRAV
jgi:hypothetical protein